MIAIFGCHHRWSFPIRLPRRRYDHPWDSSQTCTRCGAERWYSFRLVKAGPQISREKTTDSEAQTQAKIFVRNSETLFLTAYKG
jgi:hypothetical protein